MLVLGREKRRVCGDVDDVRAAYSPKCPDVARVPGAWHQDLMNSENNMLFKLPYVCCVPKSSSIIIKDF